MTDPRRVENPLSAEEAADICLDLWECQEIEKAVPTSTAPREVFQLAEELKLKGATIFDCVLAVTVKENGVEVIYTENTHDFEKYRFLKVLNPLRTRPRWRSTRVIRSGCEIWRRARRKSTLEALH
ncbi:hypothetical protein J7L60_04305 [Candidatus Bathyarchaeota archaeon]|nr:hypothetical protein [Candidatus Bathyarchaeota archaeon]